MKTRNIIPEIKRSRGYLIYDTSGKRYLDLYQDSGRAILGHRMEGLSRVIKSTVARGITASYPSIYTNRIEKGLKLLFPDVAEFRMYENIERAMIFLSQIEGDHIAISDFVDFPSKESTYGIWRPFLNADLKWNKFDYFIPILPFPGNFGPVVLAINKVNSTIAPSDDLSPMICDLLVKSLSALNKHTENNNCMENSNFNSSVWERTGPYLRFKLKSEEYSKLFKKALKNSVLLPPESWLPGIIPCFYEKGQIKNFISMLRSDYGS